MHFAPGETWRWRLWCRRELGSWNTGLVGQPPSPCSGDLPESADEAHAGHLFSRLVQRTPEGVPFKKAGASLKRMARPIRTGSAGS